MLSAQAWDNIFQTACSGHAMKMTKPKNIRGLYAITPDLADTEKLCHLVEASLLGGTSIVQYRNKMADHDLRVEQARALLALCRQQGVPLIINDHIALCLDIDADGVHLGIDDGNLSEARQQLGEDKILGASCHNQLRLAEAAEQARADYIAFGACFSSSTKPDAPASPLALIALAKQKIGLPIVAIGGITLDNAALAIESGASSIAVINALFSANDVKQTAQQFSNLFL